MIKTDEQQVAEVVRQQVQALVQKDITTLTALIAPQAELTHITGAVQTRDEWLQQIKIGRMHYFGSREELLQAEVTGDRALVIMRNRLDARIYGFRNTWPLESRTTLEKINGQWLIVASASSMY